MSDKASAPPKVSSQMEAVMRVMMGKEERTIAEKMADANRPTWEQYKKDNEDKLNLSGADQKKMEEYRRELDAERERILSRGSNHNKKKKSSKKKKKRKSDDSSNSDVSAPDVEDDDRRKSKKNKKNKKRKRKHRRRNSSSDDSSYESDEEGKQRKKRKSKKSKKKENQKDDRYRLSNFFNGGIDSDN
mmetsp:Transcript_6365/g.9377  ORF Transcript_6365/g.9377 Transcript_6365/m.9377 type:complete len:188 (+) Transcript_6365:136-699(+)